MMKRMKILLRRHQKSLTSLQLRHRRVTTTATTMKTLLHHRLKNPITRRIPLHRVTRTRTTMMMILPPHHRLKSRTTLQALLHQVTMTMKRTKLLLHHLQEIKVRRLEALSHPVMLPHPPPNLQTPIHRHRKGSPILPRTRFRRVTIQSRKIQSPLNRARIRPNNRTTRTTCLETPWRHLPLRHSHLASRP
jgi:hypothetical protein